jgi:integrase
MFYYKVKGISPKTDKGTVYMIYRNGTEIAKSTGVTVNKKHFNTSTGRVSSKDPLFANKNAQIAERTAVFQDSYSFIENFLEVPVTKEAFEERYEYEVNAPEILAKKRIVRISSIGEGIAQKEARIAELEAELKALRHNVAAGKWIMDNDLQLTKVERAERKIAEGRQRLAALDAESAEIQANIQEWQEEAGLVSSAMFADKLNEFIRAQRLNHVKESTLGNYKLIAKAVNTFKPKLQMKEMDLQFFQDFQAHLVGRGVTNNSIRGMISRIKGIYKYFADDLNLPTAFFTKFKQVKATKDENVLFLSPEELAELEALPLTARVHREVRQQFLFAVETGLRRSDYNITVADIVGREIRVKTKKTGKQVAIPATEKALQLFNDADQNFRLIPESQFNQTLRLICKKMKSMQTDSVKTFQVGATPSQKIFKKWQRMTSHVARKTFVENAVAKGIELIAIAEWLGHTDTQMLQKHYANTKQIAKREASKLLA